MYKAAYLLKQMMFVTTWEEAKISLYGSPWKYLKLYAEKNCLFKPMLF